MYNIVCNVNNVVCITYNNIAFLQNLINSLQLILEPIVFYNSSLMSQLPVFFKSVVQCGVCAPPSDKSVKTVNT